ncbi:MAG: chemotaxis protein CheW [Deltaproteobacteria bacterium]|nr:chemotaxis protein CheW [Deltaproteobacteria bacterium]
MPKVQFATFYLGDDLYGINILQVREVIQDFHVSQVPQTPAPILGLMNLRGQIVTVVHLGRNLGIQVVEPQNTCIILKTNDELAQVHASRSWIFPAGEDSVGLVVDEMGEVVEVDEEEIDASPANSSDRDSATIAGVARLDKELLTILHIDSILQLDFLSRAG